MLFESESMKRLLRITVLFFITVSTFLSNAQTTPYNKKWLFGMNWGGAWENADVHSRMGTGWGLTLEREIIANNTSVFGFSLRGRYLHTWMWGRDSRPFYGIANDENLNGTANPAIDYTAAGYAYRNFYTKTDEFSLEGLLILNKLRAHSGFKIYGFGGIGATGFNSKINQLDGTNTQYDYSNVSTFSKAIAKNDLNLLWDKTYETNGIAGQSRNSYVLSGAIGVGVGIKLSSNVYLGWEHKYTYTSTDMLDASKWNNDASPSLKNDRYHYSSLFLTVAIGAGKATAQPTRDQTTYYPPPVVPVTNPRPEITVLYPRENPVYLNDCNAQIKVSITNLESINQITVLRDGNVLGSAYYTFDRTTEVLTINTPIAGNTVFSIIAQNAGGKDTKYVYTNCGPVLTTPAPITPTVAFVSTSSNDCIAHVVASVKNVTDEKSIEVIMDGIVLSPRQYNFNPYNGSVIIQMPFNQFTSISVRATNGTSSVVESINLSCTPKNVLIKEPPVISISNSQVDKNTAGDCVAKITATVIGIEGISNIEVTRNGTILRAPSYTYNASTKVLTISNQIIGSNTFIIRAQNAVSSTTATVSLNCVPQTVLVTPSIVLIQPNSNTYESQDCKEQISAKMVHVTSVQNIDVQINGSTINKNLLHFNPTTAILTFDAVITKQATIIISASNDAGNTSQTININCAPVITPTIDVSYPSTEPYVSATCKENVTAVVTGVSDLSAIHITLNGIAVNTGLVFDAATGKLSIPVNFSGRSELLINAVGKGAATSKKITLICQTLAKPVITVVSPNANPYISTGCQEQVTAQVENVESVKDITVTLNGVALAKGVMQYDTVTDILSFPVSIKGTATIVISAVNASGSEMKSISIQCKPTILPAPTVKLITPQTTNTISNTCIEAVKIQLTNCASLENITVTENGNTIASENLAYSAITGILSFQVNVATTSTLVVTAKNNGGSASTTFVIQCKPTELPSVSILRPVGTPFISTTCSENIEAIVKNISGVNQVDVLYNNVALDKSLLTYDTTSNTLSFVHTFTANGSLIIKAQNEAGQASKTVAFECKPVLPPVLVINSPAADPFISESCSDTIIATVQNIESIDAITAYANNVLIPKDKIVFTKANGRIRLIYSYNTDTEIKLMAVNAAGTATKLVHLTCAPVLQPTIKLVNPVAETVVSTSCVDNVLMTLTNVSEMNQIQVKINSVLLNNTLYTYNAATGLLTIPVTTTTVSTVEVVATNKTKRASKTVQITCKKLPLPAVQITSPSTTVLTNCSTSVKATVTNVTSKEQLVITVDGRLLNAASYTLTANIVSIPVTVSGQSLVSITATNETGAVTEKIALTCNVSQVITGPSTNSCSTISKTPFTTCATCNDTVKVSSGNISVDANRKVCITNTFSGNVNMNGGQLVICGTATIQNINFNSGDIVVTGTASFDNVNMNSQTSAIRNYGTIRFSNFTYNGRFENHGQATIQADFNINSTAVFINTGTLNANTSFNNNNVACNSGTITINGNLKDNGSADFINSCKLIVNGQFHVNNTFENSGSIQVASTTFINGAGTFKMNAGSKLITDALIINGTINGPAQSCTSINVASQTQINSSARVSGKIDICDVNGIELKSGILAATVTTDCSCMINMSGGCGSNGDMNDQITVCHKSGDNIQTLTISKSLLASHLAHGDHIGTCTEADKTVIKQEPAVTEPVVTPPVIVAPVVVPPVEDKPVEEEKVTICHKPPGNPENVQTLTISKNDLKAHLAHGDNIGACVKGSKTVEDDPAVPPVKEEKIIICHTSGGGVQTLTVSKSDLSAHLAHGDHIGACAEEQSPVKEETIPTVQEEEKVIICHKPPGNPTNVQTLTVKKSDLKAHLAHGDYIGACTVVKEQPVVVPPVNEPKDEKVIICHKPKGSTSIETLTISSRDLAAHLAHGDHVGSCTDADKPVIQREPETPDVIVPPKAEENKVIICHKSKGGTSIETLTIPESALSSHLAHGDHVGSCTDADRPKPVEEKRVTICHKPQGSSTIETITIPESALSSHLAHGDHVGSCTDADKPKPAEEERVTICHKPQGSSIVQTITIPKSALSQHLAHGDHVGSCTDEDKPKPVEEKKVVICHKPKGSSIVQTITISESALSQHLAHGDHVGTCTDADQPVIQKEPEVVSPQTVPSTEEAKVTICHKKTDGTMETLTIPKSQLSFHLQHGDHVGVCTPQEMVK
ncbi:hypothetical protein SAMN04487930_11122 [Cytophaga hutchinsonii ATCC 33406]|nr:hypothetical protein SAMN04487930_11122 [Cytophaga hutchinsonii ATCC 33406]